MLTLNHFLIFSVLLFSVGLLGVIIRHNLVAILMSIEIMLNAVLINFIAVARFTGNVQGDLFALFIIAIAAAEVGVGLAIFLSVFRVRGGIRTQEIKEMGQ